MIGKDKLFEAFDKFMFFFGPMLNASIERYFDTSYFVLKKIDTKYLKPRTPPFENYTARSQHGRVNWYRS